MKKIKISSKFKKISEIYRIFSKEWEDTLNFDEQSLLEMYKNETFGTPVSNITHNGFYIGKRWMDVHVKMWKEGLKEGNITRKELYEDGKYPEWWLKKVGI